MTDVEAQLVVDWFLELESRLMRVLETVPYTEQSKNLFSPPLPGIIIDAASLVDAIFRDAYTGSKDRKRLKITDFYNEYEPRLRLSDARTLMFQVPLIYIEPFKDWGSLISGPDNWWWRDYNRLKHDRIKDYSRATLHSAIQALGGLHQVLVRLESFKYALLKRELLHFGQWGKRFALDRAYRADPGIVTIIVETELFATPVGGHQFPDDVQQIFPFHFASGRKLWRYTGPDF